MGKIKVMWVQMVQPMKSAYRFNIGILSALIFMTSCNQDDVAEGPAVEFEPPSYLFDDLKDEDSKIYCAGVVSVDTDEEIFPIRHIATYIALKLSNNPNIKVKHQFRLLVDADECKLPKTNLREGIEKSDIRNGIYLRTNGHEDIPRIRISAYAYNPVGALEREIESISQRCGKFAEKENEFGLIEITIMEACEPESKIQSKFLAGGVSKYAWASFSSDEPAIIRCTDPASRYPDGLCFMDTWYRQFAVDISFSAANLDKWRSIRADLFSGLDESVVSFRNLEGCSGAVCEYIEGNEQ